MYKAASGHCYFNLKDESATIKAVMFKGQVNNVSFDIENGLEVVGFGRISVYSPRGTYQLILEYLEPAGIGALQLAVEQLKRRLEKEGLFADENKKKLPPLPSTIGVVTSLTGAVIHDITQVLFRRFPNLHVIVAPSKVQGDEAADEIVAGIERLNRHKQADIIIVARGGGSLEDLLPFNTERVARAIYASRVPIISAVGHEVDVTIADLVADLRAPTPSAAAEMIVPEKDELIYKLNGLHNSLFRTMQAIIDKQRQKVRSLAGMAKNPKYRLDEYRLKLDHLMNRLQFRTRRYIQDSRHLVSLKKVQLINANPLYNIKKFKEKNNYQLTRLVQKTRATVHNERLRLNRLSSTLQALSPMAILNRGYSITRTVGTRPKTVLGTHRVKLEQHLEVILSDGSLIVQVKDKKGNHKT